MWIFWRFFDDFIDVDAFYVHVRELKTVGNEKNDYSRKNNDFWQNNFALFTVPGDLTFENIIHGISTGMDFVTL